MYVIVVCPQCGRRVKLPSEYIGREVTCQNCQTNFTAGHSRSGPSESAPLESSAPPTDEPTALPPIMSVSPVPPAYESPISKEPPAPNQTTDDDFDVRVSRVPKRGERRKSASTIPPPVPPKSNRALLIVLALVGGGAMLCCCAYRNGRDFPGPAPFPAPVPQRQFGNQNMDRPDFWRGAVQATAPVDKLNAFQQRDEMERFFVHLRACIRDKKEVEFDACFDARAMIRKLIEDGITLPGWRPEGDWQEKEMCRGVSMDQQWLNLEVVRVQPAGNEELLVVTHIPTKKGGFIVDRWRISQRNGAWVIRDMENVSSGLPLSLNILSVRDVGIPLRRPALKDDITSILNAYLASTVRLDTDEADRALAPVRLADLPASIAFFYHLTVANIRARQGRHQDALDAANAANRLRPNSPGADYYLAVTQNNLKNHKAGLRHALAYHQVVGDEPEATFEVGYSLQETRQWREAAVYYRKTLDRVPGHEAFFNLLRCIGADVSNDDIARRFAQRPRPEDDFDRFIQDRWTTSDSSTVEKLAQAMLDLQPQHAEARFQLALALADQQRVQPAVTAFHAALDRQKEKQRLTDYYGEFARKLVAHNDCLEFYQATRDPQLAFRALAAALKLQYKPDDLDELVALHAAKHAADPHVLLYQGDAHFREERFAEADKAFNQAFRTIEDNALVNQFRVSRVNARYRLGKGMSAYREIAPAHQTFGDLVQLYWTDKKIDELVALLDAHAKNDRGDPRLTRPRWRVSMHRQRFDEAAAFLQAAVAAEGNDVARTTLKNDFFFDAVDGRCAVECYQRVADKQHALAFLVSDLLGANQSKELKAITDLHRQKFPMDPLLSIADGELALARKDWKAAAKQFSDGWKGLDEKQHQRWLHSYLLARGKAGEARQAYIDTGRGQPSFVSLARNLLFDKQADSYAELVEERRRQGNIDGEFLMYEARVKLLQGKPVEAARLVQEGWRQLPEQQQPLAQADFLSDLAMSGLGIEAYGCAMNKQIAFQTLGWRYRNKENVDKFAELIDAHTQQHPDDPRLLVERGELHLLRNQPIDAEKYFLLAVKQQNANELYAAQAGLNRTRIRLGNVAAAYHALGGGHASFLTLASQCSVEKNGGQLHQLIEAHRLEFPKAKHLGDWELDVLWLNKDYPAAVKRIQADREKLLARTATRWKCQSYLVRSLVRLQKSKEAIEEAERFNQRVNGPVTLLVLALASTGDVERTIQFVASKHFAPYLIEDCYFDEDLGPMLRSERFSEFRERFPDAPSRDRFDDFRD